MISLIKRLIILNKTTFYYWRFFKGLKAGPANGKSILIYSGIGSMYLTPLEIMLYHLLSFKGYNVDYLIYNKDIKYHELVTKDNVENGTSAQIISDINNHAVKYLRGARVKYSYIEVTPEVTSLVEKVASLEDLLKYNYDGINFGEIVVGAMYRYYKSLTFDNDAFRLGKEYLYTSLVNYFQIKKSCKLKTYEYVLLSHGIYCTWGPVTSFLKNNDIHYVCYDRAKTKSNCNFNIDTPSPIWDFSPAWTRLSDFRLSKVEIERVNNYLSDRELQKGDVYSYNTKGKELDVNALREKLGIGGEKKVITIFTNLIWDAANVSRDIAFTSPLDCVKRTIEYYGQRGDISIVIRSHPAEKVLGTNERYGELIKSNIDSSLLKNTTIIEPEDEINSFSVIEISDIGIVHTSTVGLEMAMADKPVVLISDTHYRGKGFTHDAESEAHYFSIIDSLLNGGEGIQDQVVRSNKYFYLMMFEYQHKMPIIRNKSGNFLRYSHKTISQFLASPDERLNAIVSRICGSGHIEDFIFK